MSYQKHHAPSQQVINEGEEYQEDLKVIRPLQGIESNKHQPIVRANQNLNVTVSPLETKPIIYLRHLQRVMDAWDKKLSKPFRAATTQTTMSQTTAHYPSSSNGNSSKYFSIKGSKKNGLIHSNIAGNSKKRKAKKNNADEPADSELPFKTSDSDKIKMKSKSHKHSKEDEEMNKILTALRYFNEKNLKNPKDESILNTSDIVNTKPVHQLDENEKTTPLKEGENRPKT